MNPDDVLGTLRLVATGDAPLYAQLQRAIEAAIDGGELEPGSKLPVERDFAETLGISRITVRRAYDGLARAGLVARRRGAGTFVSEARVEGNLHVLAGLSDEIGNERHSIRTRIIQFGYCAPDADVRDALGVTDDALSTVRLTRVRYIDDIASTFEISWMPARIAAPLVGRDLTDASLFGILAEEFDIHPDRAVERLRSVALDAYEAEKMGCAVGSAAFAVDRTTYDSEGTAIEQAKTLLRGDRFFYSTTLSTSGSLLRGADSLSQFETLATP